MLMNADNFMLGDEQVDKLYLGDEQVWPAVAPEDQINSTVFVVGPGTNMFVGVNVGEQLYVDGVLTHTFDAATGFYDISPNIPDDNEEHLIVVVTTGTRTRLVGGNRLLRVVKYALREDGSGAGTYRHGDVSLNRQSPNLTQVPIVAPKQANMSSMFEGATSFNQDLSAWDVSSVTDMSTMFTGAVSFNQDLSGWDVSSVIYMDGMFSDAVSFNQDLSGWDVEHIPTEPTGFATNASAWVLPKPRWGLPPITMGGLPDFFLQWDADGYEGPEMMGPQPAVQDGYLQFAAAPLYTDALRTGIDQMYIIAAVRFPIADPQTDYSICGLFDAPGRWGDNYYLYATTWYGGGGASMPLVLNPNGGERTSNLMVPTEQWLIIEAFFGDGQGRLYVGGELERTTENDVLAASQRLYLASDAAPIAFAAIGVSFTDPTEEQRQTARAWAQAQMDATT